jgi:hypothetical protein
LTFLQRGNIIVVIVAPVIITSTTYRRLILNWWKTITGHNDMNLNVLYNERSYIPHYFHAFVSASCIEAEHIIKLEQLLKSIKGGSDD